MTTTVKPIAIGFIGSLRSLEMITITPGVTTTDILRAVGCYPGYCLVDPDELEEVKNPDTDIFEIADDGHHLIVARLHPH